MEGEGICGVNKLLAFSFWLLPFAFCLLAFGFWLLALMDTVTLYDCPAQGLTLGGEKECVRTRRKTARSMEISRFYMYYFAIDSLMEIR
jgi:hypothetical protein